MVIKYTSFSEKGIRSSNQDVCRVVEMPDNNRTLFIVCDGMGGHAMGDVAVRTVCDAVASYWKENPAESDDELKVQEACRAAMVAMDNRADQLHGVEMGTTMVLASIEGNKVTIAHCGDSRCYLLRGDESVYQTQDHTRLSFGWEVVSRCFFSYRPEATCPDTGQFELQAGDRLLLCSDGVYKAIPPEILTARLMDDRPLEEIADVIKFLCEKNSRDNYTAIIVQVD